MELDFLEYIEKEEKKLRRWEKQETGHRKQVKLVKNRIKWKYLSE